MDIKENIIDYLVVNNGIEYNLHKSSEEFQELALILTQKLTKPNKVNDQEIIDEIGDCIIRLEVLKKIFPIEQIQKRLDYKLSKYQDYIDTKKYPKI